MVRHLVCLIIQHKHLPLVKHKKCLGFPSLSFPKIYQAKEMSWQYRSTLMKQCQAKRDVLPLIGIKQNKLLAIWKENPGETLLMPMKLMPALHMSSLHKKCLYRHFAIYFSYLLTYIQIKNTKMSTKS